MTEQREALKKDLKLRTLFTLAFGTIIGIGWITVMGTWITQAGPMGAIIGFAGGGLVMLVIGICYAEAATMYPVSGGEVAYVYEMYGTRMSFATGWFLAFSYISTTVFESISVGWVMSALVPGFGGPVLYNILGQDVTLWSLVLGVAIMLIISAITYRGAKSTALFQDTMTITLLVVTLIFVLVGLIGGEGENLKPLFVADSSGMVIFGVMAVFVTTPFWFAGFDTIPQAMGEVQEGANLRLLPKVIFLAIFTAIIFYCLVILTASMALPRAELLAMDLPVAGALTAAFNSVWMGKLVLFAGLCGLITTWNAIFFAATRLVFSLGRGHMIPHRFAGVHPVWGSPYFAVLFVGALGVFGTFFGRNAILPIVGASAICFTLVFLVVVVGILRLRRILPNHPRPYKAPGGKAFLYIAAVFCLGLFVAAVVEPYRNAGGFPLEWGILLVWAALGVLFWLGAGKLRREVSEKDRRWLILNEGEPDESRD